MEDEHVERAEERIEGSPAIAIKRCSAGHSAVGELAAPVNQQIRIRPRPGDPLVRVLARHPLNAHRPSRGSGGDLVRRRIHEEREWKRGDDSELGHSTVPPAYQDWSGGVE